jgi:predicted small lipoprotein YifL
VRWLIPLVFATFTLFGVATCGQKGPLRLPDEQTVAIVP